MSRILVVEDEFLIRAVLVDTLEALGLSCIEAATGQAALDIVAGDTPLSAMVVDVGLPDMSGERVIEAATRYRPQTPVIRCSGGESRPPAATRGMVHVFAKPYDVEKLSKFVVSLIGGGGA